jgi:hypothetical protein
VCVAGAVGAALSSLSPTVHLVPRSLASPPPWPPRPRCGHFHRASPRSPLGSVGGADDSADFLNLRGGRFLGFLLSQLQNDSSYRPPNHVKDFR